MMTMRVGTGYDVHAFKEGDHVMLGGVRVPHNKGVLAHSDGDVIIHALCDALLGAIGQGDIGQHFPDSDPRWKGAASVVFLEEVVRKVEGMGYQVVNTDVTLIAQGPRIGAHRVAIQQTLAKKLHIDNGSVNIKATTHEGLGAIGREEGIAAQAVVLLQK